MRTLIMFVLSLGCTFGASAAPSADDFTGVAGVTWESTRDALMDKPKAKEVGPNVAWTEDVLEKEAVILATFEEGQNTPFAISVIWSHKDQELALYRLFRVSVGLLIKKYGKPTETDVQGRCPEPDQEFDMANAIRFGFCQIILTWTGEKHIISVQVSGSSDREFRLLVMYALKGAVERQVARKNAELRNTL